ncbi:MAG: Crp/Fnr family transcriptional regulator [Bacteroidota bacterium]
MNKGSKLWYLERFDLMRKLKMKDVKHLEKQLTMKKIPKGEFLYFPQHAAHHVYFIKEGIVKIARYMDDGTEDIKFILGAGNILGELSMLNEDQGEDFAVALDDCVICFIDKGTMKELISENQIFSAEIHKILGLRIRKPEQRLESVLYKDARTRILEYLDTFKEEFGKKEGDKIVVKNFLTQSDMARLTSTSRQTVATVFNQLREAGLIDYDKEKFVFKNRKLIG